MWSSFSNHFTVAECFCVQYVHYVYNMSLNRVLQTLHGLPCGHAQFVGVGVGMEECPSEESQMECPIFMPPKMRWGT